MKRNALFRIVLWGTVLLVLLAILFILFFAPRAGRRLRDETPAETMVAVPLPRVASAESSNAIVTGNQNVYSAPDPDTDVVAYAERGILLEILRQEQIGGKKWGYIGSPTLGWIDMNYVELLEPVAEEITDIPMTIPQAMQATAVTVAAARIQEIEIEWAAGTITIQPKDIGEIHILEDGLTGDAEPMVWNVREDKLSIQYSQKTDHAFGMGLVLGKEKRKDLIIQVPLDWQCDSLEIDAASASLEVNDLTIREMEFDGASGTCVFDNCTVEKLNVDTASGDVRFRGSLQQLDCDAASANIFLELNNVPRSIDLDTASGDLDVTLPADAGFTVTMDTMSGDFESDFATTSRNGSHIAGNGRCRIDVDAMSGDVTVRKGA